MLVRPIHILSMLVLLFANTATANDCFVSEREFGIGFFNGVGVVRKDAMISANKITEETGVTTIELYYNHTYGLAQDLLEVADQRLSEIPPDRRSMGDQVMTLILNSRNITALEYGSEIAAAARKFNADMPALIRNEIAAAYTKAAAILITRDATNQDYREHRDRLKKQISTTSRVLLIGHSQGNLFMNHAYLALPQERRDRAGIIHVAPASQNIYGPGVLASTDVVISGLEISSNRKMPKKVKVIQVEPNKEDQLGHGFIATYMTNPALNNEIKRLVRNDRKLATPIGIYGDFDITTSGRVMFKNEDAWHDLQGSGVVHLYPGKPAIIQSASMPSCKPIIRYDGSTVGSKYDHAVKNQISDSGKIAGWLSSGKTAGYCVNSEGVISAIYFDPSGRFNFSTRWQSSSNALSPGSGSSVYSCAGEFKS